MGIHFVEAWQNKIEIGFCFDPGLTGGRKSVEQMFSDHVTNSLKRLLHVVPKICHVINDEFE